MSTEDKNKDLTSNDAKPMLAEVNYSALGTSLEPYIGWRFPVVKRSKYRIWVERDYGVKRVIKYDSSLFNFS